MILVNPPAGGSLNADLHFVPSVHLQGDHYRGDRSGGARRQERVDRGRGSVQSARALHGRVLVPRADLGGGGDL